MVVSDTRYLTHFPRLRLKIESSKPKFLNYSRILEA